MDKSEFLFSNDAKSLSSKSFFNVLVSKHLPSNFKHILSMQQAKSFPFFSLITVKKDIPGLEFRVFFHIPDLPDGSKIPTPEEAIQMRKDNEILRKLGEPWKDFPKTSDEIKVDWNKIPDPYDDQQFYKVQQALLKWMENNDKFPPDNFFLIDNYLAYESGETIKEKAKSFYKVYSVSATDGKYTINFDINAKSQEEAKKEATKKAYTKFFEKYPLGNFGKLELTVDTDNHWVINKKELIKLYNAEKNVANYWQRIINNKNKKNSGKSSGNINTLTLKQEKQLYGVGPGEKVDDSKGLSGSNYWRLLKKSAHFFKHIITLHVKDAMADLFNDVRLVHFAGGPYEMDVSKDKKSGKINVSMVGDWTVPKGRTLKLNCNLTVKGDVWVQDGASLYITGDLNVKDPGDPEGYTSTMSLKDRMKEDISKGIKTVLRPTGRVFLGRGSTVLVEGDFTCMGSPHRGSVVVDSEIGKVNFITSAIISKGQVNIPHGIIPGISLNSVGDSVKEKNKYLGKFLNDIEYIPSQIAKVYGPFHRRYCVFATRPDPWSVVTVPIIDIFIFFPFPVGDDVNINVNVFRALTYGYTIVLNATLGENLFTDSTWWVFGRGAVPMLPKVGGMQLITDYYSNYSNITKFKDTILEDIKSLLNGDLFKKISGSLLVEMLHNVVTSAIDSVTSFSSSIVSGNISGKFGSGIGTLLSRLSEAENKVDPLVQITQSKGGLEKFLTDKLRQELEFEFYETSGVLIYANEHLLIGRENQEVGDCVYASGLFISGEDIESYADKTVGCMISINGSVTAKNFLYYPYFTRASLNIPQDKSLWVALLDPLVFKTKYYPIQIGVTLQHIVSEGWGK